ncbi:hypothetical protein F2Q68_00044287 [Brassica cretica]|uniref:Uncharacterized protein n=1 Tax=Brassica cretica TaxID=69181 RepID=A0A8S9LI70_BRACR|nr:hypothetical protein F2Q68_00044287 [Brassica cretica]
MGEEKGSVKRRRGFERPPTSEDGNASSSGFIFPTFLYASHSNAQASSSEIIRALGSIIYRIPLKPRALPSSTRINGSRRYHHVPAYYKGTSPPPGS